MSTDTPFATPSQMGPPPAKNNTLKIILIVLGVLFVLFLLCAGVLVALLMPAITAANTAAQRMSTSNDMKQIGLAMHNYHDTFQQLPPAYVTDSDGEPASSWRVSLLPFIEAQPLWDRWSSGDAWDGPANAALLSETPAAYRAVSEPDVGPHSGECHVFAIRDPRSLFPSDEKIHFRDVTDGLSNTVAFVYLPERSVPWSAPQDISLDGAYQEISKASPQSPAHFLMGDGSVRMVSNTLSRETFEALVTRNGGEMISDF